MRVGDALFSESLCFCYRDLELGMAAKRAINRRPAIWTAVIVPALILPGTIGVAGNMQAGLVRSEFIFETAPFRECHASTIVESRGTLLAAWFGGTQEKNPDVSIWLSRYEGGRWTPPEEVAKGVESPAK